MVQSILEAKGYRVLTARDGMEAVESFKDRWNVIDLVVTDMGSRNWGVGRQP